MKTIYDFTVKQIDGSEKQLFDYKENILLIVNTASKCGFTPQFEKLQSLYDKYAEKGFVILGFPCDQFGNQEFSDIDETIHFCKNNYNVTFPMFAKVYVNGKRAHPLYTFLKKEKGGLLTKDIKWNFTKFLINREGEVVNRYAPIKKPEQIEKDILKILER